MISHGLKIQLLYLIALQASTQARITHACTHTQHKREPLER